MYTSGSGRQFITSTGAVACTKRFHRKAPPQPIREGDHHAFGRIRTVASRRDSLSCIRLGHRHPGDCIDMGLSIFRDAKSLPRVLRGLPGRLPHPGQCHCLVIDAHQRLTVLRNLPSAYVALRDMQQDDQWVVVFVRKSDFEQLPDGPYPQSGPNRRMTKSHSGSRGASAFSAPPHTGPGSPTHPATVDKVHHSRLAVQDAVGPH